MDIYCDFVNYFPGMSFILFFIERGENRRVKSFALFTRTRDIFCSNNGSLYAPFPANDDLLCMLASLL